MRASSNKGKEKAMALKPISKEINIKATSKMIISKLENNHKP